MAEAERVPMIRILIDQKVPIEGLSGNEEVEDATVATEVTAFNREGDSYSLEGAFLFSGFLRNHRPFIDDEIFEALQGDVLVSMKEEEKGNQSLLPLHYRLPFQLLVPAHAQESGILNVFARIGEWNMRVAAQQKAHIQVELMVHGLYGDYGYEFYCGEEQEVYSGSGTALDRLLDQDYQENDWESLSYNEKEWLMEPLEVFEFQHIKEEVNEKTQGQVPPAAQQRENEGSEQKQEPEKEEEILVRAEQREPEKEEEILVRAEQREPEKEEEILVRAEQREPEKEEEILVRAEQREPEKEEEILVRAEQPEPVREEEIPQQAESQGVGLEDHANEITSEMETEEVEETGQETEEVWASQKVMEEDRPASVSIKSNENELWKGWNMKEDKKFTFTFRIVQESDHLDTLAQCYSCSVTEIMRANGMTHEQLDSGQVLFIPTRRR